MAMQANQMSVHEILEMIFQKKRLFLLCTLLGLGASMLVFEMAVKWYDSRAEILVLDRQTDDPNIRGLANTTSIQARFNTVRAKILSVANLVELLPKFQLRGYDPSRAASLSPAQRRAYEESLAKALAGSVQMYLRGPVIHVRVERQGEGGADEAYRMVEVLANEVQNRYIEVRESDINDARMVLERLLSQYRERLEESEKYVRHFSEMNMVDLTEDQGDLRRSLMGLESQQAGSKAMVGRLLNLMKRQDDSLLAVRKLRAQREAVAAQVEAEPEYVVSEVTTAQSSMERLLGHRLAEAQAQLIELQRDRSPEHPMVRDKMAEVARFTEQLEKVKSPVVTEERKSVNQRLVQLRSQLNQLDADIAAAESERHALEEEVDALTERIKQIPMKELRRSELVREMNVARQMYQNIRMRFENAELTHQLEIKDRQTRFETIRPPSVNPAPIRPNRKFILIMGTFLGMVMGLVVCFLREFTDTSFRNLEDASRFLDLPVLGVIPEVTKMGKRRTRMRSSSGMAGGGGN